MSSTGRLVLVSNRVPPSWVFDTGKDRPILPVGGLVSAVRPIIDQMEALWFGWSGKRTDRKGSPAPSISRVGRGYFALMDLPKRDANLYYSVFSNRALWPLFHNFPDKIIIRRDAYKAYRRVNRRFAEALRPKLRAGDLVWVHDYHLLPMGRELRDLGWKGKIGFFLHVPFPSHDTFTILPWARKLLEDLMAYDLVGLQTRRNARNLLDTLSIELRGVHIGNQFIYQGMNSRVGVYPVGTDPDAFHRWAQRARNDPSVPHLRETFTEQRVILGVDRLDYTKGVPERILAFEHLLARRPTLRGKIGLVQISVPSRERVPEYIQERARVDQIVGRVNGRFSEVGWIPLKFLYRSFSQPELAGFFSEADVCLVTPLQDGLNLVAKEYVASRRDDPGTLVLSKFSGAAEKMVDAIIVNPHDVEGTANAIHRALTMSSRERRRRWNRLVEEVETNTARTWSEAFLADLAGT